MEAHWQSLLYPIAAGVTVQAIVTVLRYIANRRHKDAILQETRTQTALLRSLDRRMRGFELFTALPSDITPKG